MKHSKSPSSYTAASLLALNLISPQSAAAEENREKNEVGVSSVFSANIEAAVNSAVLRLGLQMEGGNDETTPSGDIAPRRFFETALRLRLSDEFPVGAVAHFGDSGEMWEQSFGPEACIRTGSNTDYFGVCGNATFTARGLASAFGELRVRAESGFIVGAKVEGDVNQDRQTQRWCVGPEAGYGPKNWPVEGTFGIQSCDAGAPEGPLDDMRVMLGVDARMGK